MRFSLSNGSLKSLRWFSGNELHPETTDNVTATVKNATDAFVIFWLITLTEYRIVLPHSTSMA